jgi:N-acetylated-alpha-linked acidic dipeptidase
MRISYDTIEIADKDIFLRDIKVYLLAVFRNATAEILPFDWRLTAKEFLDTIERYQKKAGTRFDLSPARKATAELSRRLEQFYGDVGARKIPAAEANRVIMELARILVPINFTRQPRFRHDPALTIPPLPTISTATELDDFDANKIGFALTQLTRGQNRLVSALRQAVRLVDSARRPALATV